MPDRDGTGPTGEGPRTGNGLGQCGQGFRRGRGRGLGARRLPILSKVDEISMLEEEKQLIENRLTEIRGDING